MLLDVISIFVGFVGIILLLSLAVTSTVELLQSILVLRRRIFRAGLQALFDEAAAGIDFTTLRREKRGLVPRETLRREDIPALVTIARGSPDSAAAERIDRLFPLMEQRTSERFKTRIRLVTLGVSFVVAFLMQASAIDIVQRLARDPAYRAATLSIAESLGDPESGYRLEINDYSVVAGDAIQTIADRHPELAELLEEVSGEGETLGFILAEMDQALADGAPQQRAPIMREYEALLARRAADNATDALAQLARVEGELAALQLVPWREGPRYFTDPINWIGVLLTTVLLSLGAPFWFDVLRRFIGLLNTMQGRGAPTPNPSAPAPPANT